MLYTVIWNYTDESGDTRKVVSHPDTYEDVDSPAKAKEEGVRVLAELPPEFQGKLRPLSVVEINYHITEDVLQSEEIELDLPGEGVLEFYVVDDLPYWENQAWWSK